MSKVYRRKTPARIWSRHREDIDKLRVAPDRQASNTPSPKLWVPVTFDGELEAGLQVPPYIPAEYQVHSLMMTIIRGNMLVGLATVGVYVNDELKDTYDFNTNFATYDVVHRVPTGYRLLFKLETVSSDAEDLGLNVRFGY